MEKTTIAAAAVILFSAFVGATPLVLDQTTTKTQESSFSSNVTVLNTSRPENRSIGVNPDPNLQFGRVPLQANITKTLNLSSNKLVFLRVTEEGNISSTVETPEKMLFEGKEKVPVEAQGLEPGYYEGTITLKMQVAQNDLGRKWLELKSKFY